ncbi:MAG: tyrosine-type recombinase/integrase [Acidobacteriota bacterium]
MATIQKRDLKSGGVRWRAIVRRKGHPDLFKQFRRRSDAVHWAAKTEAAILDGKLVPGAAANRRTVSDLVAGYEAHYFGNASQKSVIDRRRHFAFWAHRLGPDTPLTAITRAMLSGGLRALRDGKGPSGRPLSDATANRYLATIRHALTWAEREDWIERNPARTGLQRKEPRGRVRYLSADERERLFAAVAGSSPLELLVHLAISTGARVGSLMALRWGDIQWDRKVAILEHTKNGDRHSIALDGHAWDLLQERRGEQVTSPERPVFEDETGGNGAPKFPRGAWERALEEARIENFRFHDLRHTAASYLAMSGATLAEIAEFLGHRTLAMVKRYAHLSESHTHSVARRMMGQFLS